MTRPAVAKPDTTDKWLVGQLEAFADIFGHLADGVRRGRVGDEWQRRILAHRARRLVDAVWVLAQGAGMEMNWGDQPKQKPAKGRGA